MARYELMTCTICGKTVIQTNVNQKTCLSGPCKAAYQKKHERYGAKKMNYLSDNLMTQKFTGGRNDQIIAFEREARSMKLSYGEMMRRKEAGLL